MWTLKKKTNRWNVGDIIAPIDMERWEHERVLEITEVGKRKYRYRFPLMPDSLDNYDICIQYTDHHYELYNA